MNKGNQTTHTPSHDSILELWRTSPSDTKYSTKQHIMWARCKWHNAKARGLPPRTCEQTLRQSLR